MDYEKDIEIDESQLDVECLEHSVKVLNYNKDLADALYDWDVAKDNYELVRAQADSRIREDPLAYNGCPKDKDRNPKPTEGWVSSILLQEEDVKQAQIEVHIARKKYGYLQAACKSFEHRDHRLENLIKLCLSDYFARPPEPRDLTEVMRERRVKDREQARESSKQEAGVRAKKKLDKKRK